MAESGNSVPIDLPLRKTLTRVLCSCNLSQQRRRMFLFLLCRSGKEQKLHNKVVIGVAAPQIPRYAKHGLQSQDQSFVTIGSPDYTNLGPLEHSAILITGPVKMRRGTRRRLPGYPPSSCSIYSYGIAYPWQIFIPILHTNDLLVVEHPNGLRY